MPCYSTTVWQLVLPLTLVLLEILRLFKDLPVDLIPIHRWVAVLCQHQNQRHLQLRLDVIALAPIGVSHLVVHYGGVLGTQYLTRFVARYTVPRCNSSFSALRHGTPPCYEVAYLLDIMHLSSDYYR